ncbi:kinesin-like protein KIN-14I isoform X2 [Punica granatum]|uniref:Kinesin-like protein KIN-14I isoform X2 n=1 Tax=Punica granatum TaxID=22663 RepID=A0A6P8C7M5_PUNGR|nr:kinesin-like protein KIN-14I isoform X2 [Punica granatum]
MAATEQALPFSLESVVEDVLQQHGTLLSDRNLASRKAEEASSRRYEAAGWLRRMVGVVGGKDLPAEPSEEEFRLGLRSGIILCNVLNKIQPGAVPKVVEGPSDSVIIPDGAALSAYQYFENVRNFLVAMEEMGLPTFEASDLEQGGKSARIVNCALALKAYSDWKQAGGIGSWKFGGNLKPITSGKHFVRKNSEPFMNSFSRTSSASEQYFLGDLGHDLSEAAASRSLNVLVRQILSDKKQEDIPIIVEAMLGKVMEEFEHRLANQNGVMEAEREDSTVYPNKPLSTTSSEDMKEETEESPRTEEIEEKVAKRFMKEHQEHKCDHDEQLTGQIVKHQRVVERQQKHIQELKQTLTTTKAQMQFLQTKYLEEFGNIGKQMYGLAHAASGYQKVLEENRRLYNQVQDLKGNIRVYCRVRPFLPGQPNSVNAVGHLDDGSITIITPSKYGKEGRKSFTFNRVFGPTATQAEVFADTEPLIRSVLDGYNVCIFAYGQTGSGKTHTMSGPKDLTEESMGVNYRALSDLFLISKQRKDTIAYDIFVQMIEIYNEQVRDLLVTDGSIKRLEIRNSSNNGINVPDANLVPVSSTADVVQLMNLGHRNRAVSATALNDRSSRSHSCLTVHVQGKETSGTTLRGCMHLVDLAGSERVDKSEVVGDRLKEAQHINKSLSALGDVISSLAQKNSHVPYRNSKLTQLLQDSLGGQAKTLMFVHISPEPDALGETISTLKFAERVSSVELGAARVNKDSSDVKELKEQIASLKAALARKDGEGEQHSRSSSPERYGVKSAGSSSSNLSWPSLVNTPSNHRQPIEDIANVEVQNKTVSQPKRRSFDLQDLLANSPPWPPISSPGLSGKEDDKESVSGEWVDKVMVKGVVSQEENPPVAWEAADNKKELPQMFYNGFTPDRSKIYPENQHPDVQRNRDDVGGDHDSDDLDATTSDSSEADPLWQYNASKTVKSGLGPKNTKKPQLKTAKSSSEMRSMIPSLIPNLTKKTPNGVSTATNRAKPGSRRNGGGK